MHEQIARLKPSLIANGWAAIETLAPTVEFLEDAVVGLAQQLGSPRASRRGGCLVDHLRPISANDANPKSLSASHGKGAFPWHTDGAHWSVPPRYLVLACAQASPNVASTGIWDGRQSIALNSAKARLANFKVSNGAQSFYATPASPLQSYYRFDLGCMSPLDSSALRLLEEVEDEGDAIVSAKISWERGLIVIIDNWRCLHRRVNAEQDITRHLLRATVME